MPQKLVVLGFLLVSSMFFGGASHLPGANDESLDVICIETDAEGCQFCISVTGSDGNTREACDTKSPCASNQVCSGEGGGDAQGNPWAKAICKSVSDSDAPIQ